MAALTEGAEGAEGTFCSPLPSSVPGTKPVPITNLLNEHLTKCQTFVFALEDRLLAQRITVLLVFLEVYATQEWSQLLGRVQR